jgi:hypothetical protein
MQRPQFDKAKFIRHQEPPFFSILRSLSNAFKQNCHELVLFVKYKFRLHMFQPVREESERPLSCAFGGLRSVREYHRSDLEATSRVFPVIPVGMRGWGVFYREFCGSQAAGVGAIAALSEDEAVFLIVSHSGRDCGLLDAKSAPGGKTAIESA